MENFKLKGVVNYAAEVPRQPQRPAIVALPSGLPKPKLLD
jgi:hypothetical protein